MIRSFLRNTRAVAWREFTGYFLGPVGYIVVGVYAAITGMGFVASFLFYAQVSVNPSEYAYPGVPNFEETLLSPFLVFCGSLFLFIAPFVTMRSLAEERHRGTMELLLTHPLRDGEIIFGKYLAAMGVFVLMLGAVAVHLGIIAWYVQVEPAVLLFGLAAVVLMGAAILSIGLFVSAMCSNQITAAITTFGILMVSYVLGNFGDNLPKKNPIPPWVGGFLRDAMGAVYAFLRNVLQQLPIDRHAKEMAKGVVEPLDIVYYVLCIAFFLFLTFRALESRKWRA